MDATKKDAMDLTKGEEDKILSDRAQQLSWALGEAPAKLPPLECLEEFVRGWNESHRGRRHILALTQPDPIKPIGEEPTADC